MEKKSKPSGRIGRLGPKTNIRPAGFHKLKEESKQEVKRQIEEDILRNDDG